MPILSQSSRRSWSHRLAVIVIYCVLALLGTTMVVPLLITLTLSVSNGYDYPRYNILPRFFFSEDDRFVKYLTGYFNSYSGWQEQFAAYFPDVPDTWSSWAVIGADREGDDVLARHYLQTSVQQQAYDRVMAADYADFSATYSLDDSVIAADSHTASEFFARRFEHRWEQQNPQLAVASSFAQRHAGALELLRNTWKIPFNDFDGISFSTEMHAPLWQQSWFPPDDPRANAFIDFKAAEQNLELTPGALSRWRSFARNHGATSDLPLAPKDPSSAELWQKFRREIAPASSVVPYAARVDWKVYLQSNTVHDALGLARADYFDVAYYNRLAGTAYTGWSEIPYPLPASAPASLQKLWLDFSARYPLRLTTLAVTPELTARFQNFLQARFKTVPAADTLMGTSATAWTDFSLSATPPRSQGSKALRSVWTDFARTVPASGRQLHSSEESFQAFMLARYGSVEGLNKAWGTHHGVIEEVFPPFAQAYEVTFRENQGALFWNSLIGNYTTVLSYLVVHADAVPVTFLLIFLAILCSLTINPLAAYALSRFNMRGQDKIILFLLATSAFPAMISAIPSFLLMRDLGLLNTFFALILPTATNGMSIFILKGFFDSLPAELFEAATIDGAKEWQIFLHVTMPMVKPILAVNALTAFLAAYEGWQWALIVCQNPKMWTLAVWMYQASQWWASTPWIASAGFVVISIPTLVVFLTCQRIILRGIIIPQMK
jgi:ABC-type glycerol-3-phosphate transport system permease component